MTGFRTQVVALLPTLLRYARSLTRDRSAAEDLVHDALVAALARADSFDRARPMAPWLLGIVHHRFVSDRRHDRVVSGHIDRLRAEDPAGTTPPQERAATLAETDAALAALPAEQRAALHLVAVEELSYQEAAAALDVPIGTIMSRIARARRSLRARRDAPAPSGAIILSIVRRSGGEA